METITVSAGVGHRPEHRLIKRDARQLLWALGEVERDLQGTLGTQWILAMRSSLSIIAQNDGSGLRGMTTIPLGLDPADLNDGAMTADRLEATLTTDALDSVGYATHWLLYDSGTHWPTCREHPQAGVAARQGRWICSSDDHEIAQVGHLAPPRKRRMRRDGTIEYLDEIDDP